jgi:hypothetical protein
MKNKPSKRELEFCHGRLEQYWILIEEKLHKRKLRNKKAEKYKDLLCQWEDVIFKLLGI